MIHVLYAWLPVKSWISTQVALVTRRRTFRLVSRGLDVLQLQRTDFSYSLPCFLLIELEDGHLPIGNVRSCGDLTEALSW